MCACTCVHVCVCICMLCTYVRVCVDLDLVLYMSLHVCMCTCTCTYIRIRTYMCKRVHVRPCMYVNINVDVNAMYMYAFMCRHVYIKFIMISCSPDALRALRIVVSSHATRSSIQDTAKARVSETMARIYHIYALYVIANNQQEMKNKGRKREREI